ncbi:hypothetical protein BDW22DRAFT_1362846 [Trametopsis cervina]|nr:hypothetical protein BDW22DRAFT_1362846 [Trametopsis cervina]
MSMKICSQACCGTSSVGHAACLATCPVPNPFPVPHSHCSCTLRLRRNTGNTRDGGLYDVHEWRGHTGLPEEDCTLSACLWW